MYKASADDIVKYARTWIGAKWRHQGRGPGGIDCAGLLIRTADHFGLPYTDMLGYRRDPSPLFTQNVRKSTLPFKYPIHGAIGIFNDTVQPCHTGIFATDGEHITVIHSEASPKGRCHEQLYEFGNATLADRLVAIRLFKEVDYVV